MITNELVDFLRTQVAAKIPKEQIAAILKPGGWTDADLAEAYTALQVVDTPLVPNPPVFEVKKFSPSTTVEASQPTGSFAGGVNYNQVKPQTQPQPQIKTEQQPQSQPSVQSQVKIQPQPQSSFRIQTMPSEVLLQKKKTSKIIIFAVIVIILALVGAGAWYFLILKKVPATSTAVTDNSSAQPKESLSVVTPDNTVAADADMIKTWTKIPDEQNAAPAIIAAGKMLSKEDTDFLSKYFSKGYDVNNLPIVSSANAVGARTVAVLSAVMRASTTPFFQCSYVMTVLTPEQCNSQPVRDIGRLLLLRSYVLERAGKMPEALSVTQSLVDLGRKVTAQSDDLSPMLVGWIFQKDGYQRIISLNSKLSVPFSMSSEEKNSQISSLREEHKNIFKFLYTREIEGLEYLADKNKVPSFPQTADDIATAEEYRKSIALGSFNLTETKKYFYDSYKTAISNVDLTCGSQAVPPPYDFTSEVNMATTTGNQSSVENYVGKILYWTTYASFDNLNTKRCEVEDLINKL